MHYVKMEVGAAFLSRGRCQDTLLASMLMLLPCEMLRNVVGVLSHQLF